MNRTLNAQPSGKSVGVYAARVLFAAGSLSAVQEFARGEPSVAREPA
jgi:hypothetical protein